MTDEAQVYVEMRKKATAEVAVEISNALVESYRFLSRAGWPDGAIRLIQDEALRQHLSYGN